jgi:hypothetical protein
LKPHNSFLLAVIRALLFLAITLAAADAIAQAASVPVGSALNNQATHASQADLDKLREALSKTREELAELKPIAAVTSTIFYFVAGISALLGFFGWRKFSDLDALVGEQVKLQLPRSQREYAEFEELTKNAEELHKKLLVITADYDKALSNLSNVDLLGPEFDIEGKIAIAVAESTKRRQKLVHDDEDTSTESMYEPVWRSSVIALLTRVPDIIKKKNLDGDLLFNIAQLCRRMEQQGIAEQVTRAAFERLPSAANRALMLSSIVKNGESKAAPKAFEELLGMVEGLTRDQPHIVMAEAWNAAVDLAGFGQLVQSINKLIAKKGADKNVFLPSYALAIKARCVLSESKENCISEASSVLADSKSVLKRESISARWARSALDEISQCERILAQTHQLGMALAPRVAAPIAALTSQAGDFEQPDG